MFVEPDLSASQMSCIGEALSVQSCSTHLLKSWQKARQLAWLRAEDADFEGRHGSSCAIAPESEA